MDDTLDDFDSPRAVRAMNRRHAELGMMMQEFGVAALIALRDRGEITAEECVELMRQGLELERTADPRASRKRH
jgi:hypothetical protein